MPASFQRKYGEFVGVSRQVPTGYSLTAAWMTGLGQAAGEFESMP